MRSQRGACRARLLMDPSWRLQARDQEDSRCESTETLRLSLSRAGRLRGSRQADRLATAHPLTHAPHARDDRSNKTNISCSLVHVSPGLLSPVSSGLLADDPDSPVPASDRAASAVASDPFARAQRAQGAQDHAGEGESRPQLRLRILDA